MPDLPLRSRLHRRLAPGFAGAAVAWNPSLPGAKSEDTVLVHPDGGLEIVTLDPRWPTTRVAGRTRPAVWVR